MTSLFITRIQRYQCALNANFLQTNPISDYGAVQSIIYTKVKTLAFIS